ncbi:MAG TPA: TerY-C metal binding domain-containing protein [Pyrinomonadaceae bacterium]|nr:TerY-C metal binding domain-containing protein [Pyrinomonadaceae bacterium]
MSYNRRLPVYLLIDCSESMAGDSFSAVTRGLATLIGDLRSNPMALETAAISVITFASSAQQIVPLTEIIFFQMPKLKMGSGTALGSALRLWLDCMNREVVKTTADQKGDYKPICFLLTDGDPTDSWEEIADHVRTAVTGKQANVVVVACGADADTNKLRRITETVLVVREDQPNAFANFFKWVSASVSMTSQKIETGGGQPITSPSLPEGMESAASGREAPLPDRWVFLHLRCVKNRGFYILRHEKQESRYGSPPEYTAIAAHAVNDFEFQPGEEAPQSLQVSSDSLIGTQPCPYCQDPNWAMCANGHLHCCPRLQGSVSLTCPWCNATASYGVASFDVGRGIG